MPQMSQADIERMIAEKAPLALQQHVQKLQQDQMVNTFVQKMQAAEQQHPGLEQELNNLNYNDPRMHSFIAMANQMENTGDIMKEVLDNPSKMESLLNMAYNQPYQAQKALKSLSDSIKTNQTAKDEEVRARDPMSQIKSSTTSGNSEKSQHDMSQEDLRRLLVKKFK
jgi:thioredoxin-like negative regulator of GroEL